MSVLYYITVAIVIAFHAVHAITPFALTHTSVSPNIPRFSWISESIRPSLSPRFIKALPSRKLRPICSSSAGPTLDSQRIPDCSRVDEIRDLISKWKEVEVARNSVAHIIAERFGDETQSMTALLRLHCQNPVEIMLSCEDLYQQAIDQMYECGCTNVVVYTDSKDAVHTVLLEGIGFVKGDIMKCVNLMNGVQTSIQLWTKYLED